MPRSAARITGPPQPEPFYGWRYVKKVLPDGSVDLVEVPLTLEDLLHPEEGDVIPENEFHRTDAVYLEPIFHERARRLPGGYVLGDRLVNWGLPGVRNHCPDLVVFRDVANLLRGPSRPSGCAPRAAAACWCWRSCRSGGRTPG
jgi:hypothetical protein